eukprot:Awhi_evm1s11468
MLELWLPKQRFIGGINISFSISNSSGFAIKTYIENVLFQQQEVIHSYFKSTSEDENKRELKNTIHENDGYQANIIFHAMAVHNSYHSHSGKLSSDCHFAKVTQ